MSEVMSSSVYKQLGQAKCLHTSRQSEPIELGRTLTTCKQTNWTYLKCTEAESWQLALSAVFVNKQTDLLIQIKLEFGKDEFQLMILPTIGEI